MSRLREPLESCSKYYRKVKVQRHLPTSKQVPGRDIHSACSWERHAWPSRKSLSSWLSDLLERVGLLRRWAAALTCLPNPLWLPGLFNPTAFLTALKQVSSRKLGLPLDKITVETRVTCMETSEEVTALGSLPPQGALVNGFLIEGARWNGCSQVRLCMYHKLRQAFDAYSSVRLSSEDDSMALSVLHTSDNIHITRNVRNVALFWPESG